MGGETMKTGEILLLAGLGIGGLYVWNNQKKDSTGAGGGITIVPSGGGTDLSGLISGLGGLLGNLGGGGGGSSGLGLGDISSLLGSLGKSGAGVLPDITDTLAALAGAGEDVTEKITGAGEAATKNITETGNNLLDKILAVMNNPAKTDVPTPKGQPGPDSEVDLNASKENDATSAIRQKVASEVVTVGGAYGASKLIPWLIKALGPRIAESLGGKIALAGSGIGTPLAIGWTLADILATIYEGMSGKNIAGSWLGWGELLGETSLGRTFGFKQEPFKPSETPSVKAPGNNPLSKIPGVGSLIPYANIPKVPEVPAYIPSYADPNSAAAAAARVATWNKVYD
jgi:hypothetical protein